MAFQDELYFSRMYKKKRISKHERAHEDWMASSTLSSYNYLNDARLESMMNYPKRKILYRKHMDIDKNYERKARYYKICQNWCNTDRNRQIRDTEEKFTKLIKHTMDSTRTRTHSLVDSYNKWISRSLDQEEFEKIFDNNLRAIETSNNAQSTVKPSPTPQGHVSSLSETQRPPTNRSSSADVIKTSRDLDIDQTRREVVKQKQKLNKIRTSLDLC